MKSTFLMTLSTILNSSFYLACHSAVLKFSLGFGTELKALFFHSVLCLIALFAEWLEALQDTEGFFSSEQKIETAIKRSLP